MAVEFHGGDFDDTLDRHLDSKNCSQSSWEYCFVAWKQIWLENLDCTATVVLIGTSHKSFHDALERRDSVFPVAAQFVNIWSPNHT